MSIICEIAARSYACAQTSPRLFSRPASSSQPSQRLCKSLGVPTNCVRVLRDPTAKGELRDTVAQVKKERGRRIEGKWTK